MNIQALLERATEAQWEIYLQHSRRAELQLRGEDTEAQIQQELTGYGIRILMPRPEGVGVGFASCNTEEEMEATARRAYELAKLNRTPFFVLPSKHSLPTVQNVDAKISRDPEAATKDYAEAAQAIIRDEKDVSLTYGKVRTSVVDTQILNSRGLSCKSKGTYIYLEMTFRVGRGTNPTEFWPTRYARRMSDVSPNRLIRQWLDVAKSSLKRHPPSTKQTTVIIAPQVCSDIFVPTIGFHATGEAVEQNISRFKEGMKVAPKEITIIDDGLYPFGFSTNPFDDEGTPQGRTILIEDGVFKKYIYDQIYAHSLRAKPTGNGLRSRGFGPDIDERYQTLPANMTTNLVIKPGTQKLEELISDVKDGILIHHCAWVNPEHLTTRFGSEIRNAQEIKNGEIGDGIVGGTISGSALELLQNTTGLSDTAEVISGRSSGCVAPFMRFEKVQISGVS